MRQEAYEAALEAWNDRPDYEIMDRLQIAINVAVETERGEITEYTPAPYPCYCGNSGYMTHQEGNQNCPRNSR